jgi:hypothetical protein
LLHSLFSPLVASTLQLVLLSATILFYWKCHFD